MKSGTNQLCRCLSVAAVLFGVSALVTPACAADEEAAVGVEEVIVTAQKRAENIQAVPLSIMAVGAAGLEARNVDDPRGLERIVPGLRLQYYTQVSSIAVRIRGFGTPSNAAIDPSVAPYIDDIYVPRPGAILSTFLDVQSVEVLRGPQGTLFGRNATAGAVSIRTHAPLLAQSAARLAGQVGSYGELQADGFVNVPVGADFAFRVAGLASKADGYVKNLDDGRTYGQKALAEGRLSALWEPAGPISWTGRFDYAHSSGDGQNFDALDTATASPAQVAIFIAKVGGVDPTLLPAPGFVIDQHVSSLNLNDRQYGVSSDLRYATGAGYTVRLIDAYRDWRQKQADGDTFRTPLNLANRESVFDSVSQSHELQVISPKNFLLGGRLDFVAGLYYFTEDYGLDEVLNLGPDFCGAAVTVAAPTQVATCIAGPADDATVNHFRQSATSRAAYLQADLALTKTVSATFGIRNSADKKSGTFAQSLNNPAVAFLRAPETVDLSFDDSRPSWRGGLQWSATPEVMAFATYSTGYKSGGLNAGTGAAVLGGRRMFASETSEDWEAGIKSVLFDRRLLLNVTAYRTDLKDFQERSFDGISFIVKNAGSIRAQGVELESQLRPAAAVVLDFAGAYLDSKFTDNPSAPGLPGCTGTASSCPTIQNLAGRPSTFAPKWTVNYGGEYRTPALAGGYELRLRLDGAYVSSYYSTSDLNPQSLIDAYTLYSGRLTLAAPRGGWTLALFGDNLTDERYFLSKVAQALDGVLGVRVAATGATMMRGYVGPPRTLGVRVEKTF